MITTQPRVTPTKAPPPNANTIVERMADRMLDMGMNGTAVTVESLFEHTDFTRDEIKAHSAEAADLARSLAVRQRS